MHDICNIQAYPWIYPWSTAGLTQFIKAIYTHERQNMKAGGQVNPLNVELCAILERALNFMHSGNTKVIATSIMNRLWIGEALIQDGIPCLNPAMVRFFADQWELVAERIPYNSATGIPSSAARTVIIHNYGDIVFNVSMIPCHSRHSCCACTNL